jgi:Mg2+/citrate symporter
MDLGTGIALLIAFLAVVVLIIRGQSPIIMLLIIAVLWSAIAGIGIDDIQKKILQAGGIAYASAVIIIVFGAWFAQILIQTGIAESVIRSAVELAGDRPLVTAMMSRLSPRSCLPRCTASVPRSRSESSRFRSCSGRAFRLTSPHPRSRWE